MPLSRDMSTLLFFYSSNWRTNRAVEYHRLTSVEFTQVTSAGNCIEVVFRNDVFVISINILGII